MSHFSYPSKYSAMKPKEGMFDSSYVADTDSFTYYAWERELNSYKWEDITKRFAENLQFALLRAMAVVGVWDHQWKDVFAAIYNEYRPFKGLSKGLLHGDLQLDWRFFAQNLALEDHNLCFIHFPPYYPEWLLPYGYDQHQYLTDISVYWNDIDEDYYIPWPTTRFGQDSPAVARLRKLGDVARQEIDLIGGHASSYLT